jgi:hypothetical protein
MGNCAGLCKSKLLRLKGDIILEKNSNNETGKYLETDNIQKIIYLQKNVKKYLKKVKSSKPKLPEKTRPKSPTKKKIDFTQEKK